MTVTHDALAEQADANNRYMRITIECPHCNAPSRVSGDNARYLVEAIDAGDTIEFICTVCRGHLDVDQAGVRAA